MSSIVVIKAQPVIDQTLQKTLFQLRLAENVQIKRDPILLQGKNQ